MSHFEHGGPLRLVDFMSVAEDDALRAVESIGAGNDDLIADRQSVENLDFGDAGGAEPHRPAFGDIAMDEIGKPAAFLINEGATVDHQHVVALIDEDSNRQSLALAQAGRLFAAEAQSCRDLP